jgi:hypothetical protein
VNDCLSGTSTASEYCELYVWGKGIEDDDTAEACEMKSKTILAYSNEDVQSCSMNMLLSKYVKLVDFHDTCEAYHAPTSAPTYEPALCGLLEVFRLNF